jgi:hypothetical protein
MSNPYGSYESQCDDFVDPRQEHEDFEAGAEDMELRFMRLEAERDYNQERMFDAMDMLDEMRAARNGDDGEFFTIQSTAILAPVDLSDDIPF